MIYGYYCIHPELVDEHYRTASCKQRIERLTAFNAPEIILVHERRIFDEKKAFLSDLSQFRNRIKKLYSDGVENDILDNYRTVFRDVGFDSLIAYSGNDSAYDRSNEDYLKPIESLSDEAVLGFISYVQSKFDEYIAKYTPKLNEIRAEFISRIKLLVERGQYPAVALEKLDRLEQTTIEIDDGFETTLEKSSGWYNAYRNQIMLSAVDFGGRNALILFHECFHALAGMSDDGGGFHRLNQFFDDEYKDAFALINETYVNAQSIGIFSGKPPERLKEEQIRDAKIEYIVKRTGRHSIPDEIFKNAYFSDNIDDIKILADAVKSVFNFDELLTGLQSIKDIESVDDMKYTYICKTENRRLIYERRFDNIDAYFCYRCHTNSRVMNEMFEHLLKKYYIERVNDENQE